MTETHYQPILLWLLHLKLCWTFTGTVIDLVICNVHVVLEALLSFGTINK